ncbi:hypothetical protein [Agromyces sp. NPDC056965]|uniref:hypothetical protein n=1 Tax=Agromyces sp. NPDC056965 TaxID=3345983 RepID=UPI00362BC3EE
MTDPNVFRRLTRVGPRPLSLLVAAAAIALIVGNVGRATIVDADSRVQLLSAVEEENTAIDRVVAIGAIASNARAAAESCISRVSERLDEAAKGDPKLPAGSIELAAQVAETASLESPRAVVFARPQLPVAGAGVTELRASLVDVADARLRVTHSVRSVADGAVRATARCAEVRHVFAAFVASVRTRTDELLAANPKAAREATAELQAAQVAVAVGDSGAAPRWIAAVNAVEASHALAVRVEAEAAAAAAAAAAESASRSERVATFSGSPPPVMLGSRDPAKFLEQCKVSSLCNPYGTVGSDPSTWPTPMG